ncbi:glycosyltransferase family 4 protein [Erysipelatoclostridium sp. An173]|uniref:glycosyltransferase family 4 protein n=1 Tax=Erysipelatoclostridium sp. An173 TaxID=1965571 RepID=UPI001302BA53|nr:glycosyltransferase family 4 protein [Erysipelatoclostridium sp. An173]
MVMMKKAIIIASVASMIDQFNRDNINLLHELGYEVSVACNFEYGSSTSNEQVKKLIKDLDELNVKHYHIPIPRSMFALKDMFKSYEFLKQLALKEKYNLMHCHSPIGGVLARLAFKKSRRQGTKVIYTAHGFHFYDGAPLKNWIIFYPIEKLCSKLTDCLITINKEDYKRAKEKFYAKEVEYVPGIGVHVEEIQNTYVDVIKKKAEFGITDEDEKILISVGELNTNKNHEIIIKALSMFKTDVKFKYILCGKGDKEKYLKELVKQLNLQNKVIFVGYRNDIKEILKISDIFCFPSYREGLSVALMEAMAAGLPCIVSKIRGNIDLVNENGGFLCEPNDINSFYNGIKGLLNKNKRICMGNYNKLNIQKFDVCHIIEKISMIYGI